MAGLESMIVEDVKTNQNFKVIDREKVKHFFQVWDVNKPIFLSLLLQTCPLLLRVFCSTGRHHAASDYAHGNFPANELQIYTVNF